MGRNKEKRAAYMKQYREVNALQIRESQKAYMVEYRSKNAQKISARMQEYYQKNKVRLDVRQRAWEKLNPDRVLEYHRKWAQKNKNKCKTKCSKRRALQSSAGDGTVNAESIAAIIAENGGMCVYCEPRGRVPANKATTIDHVVPLALGGAHAVHNLVGACKTCNSAKGGKTVAEWVQSPLYKLI